MLLAVEDRCLHIYHRVTGQRAGIYCLPDTLLDRRLEGSRDSAAKDIPTRTRSRCRAPWFHPHVDFGELAGAAGLFLVAVHGAAGPGNRFLIRHLGHRGFQSQPEFLFQAADGCFDMGSAHAFQNDLSGARLIAPVQCGVLFHQASEARSHLWPSWPWSWGLPPRQRPAWGNRRQADQRMPLIAQGIAGHGFSST